MNLKEVLINLNDEDITLLYNNYKNSIFLFVLNITKDYFASEDIVEEVFYRIIKYHKSYNHTMNPKTWIFTIARNTTYTYLKKHREITMEDVKIDLLVNQHNSIKTKDSLIVEESLSYLNDLEREIVILHIFGGLTYLEIAETLDMKYSQVRIRYSNAKKKLKEILKNGKEKESRSKN